MLSLFVIKDKTKTIRALPQLDLDESCYVTKAALALDLSSWKGCLQVEHNSLDVLFMLVVNKFAFGQYPPAVTLNLVPFQRHVAEYIQSSLQLGRAPWYLDSVV